MKTAELRSSLLAQGAELAAGTPEEFAAFIKSETARLRTVVEVAGIRME
jgi:tripartite-type tricarboxylate transporter receptor subunit TctC